MTKPNFRNISRIEPRTYLNTHRDNNEAWDIFFDKLEQERDPDAKQYPPTLTDEEMLQILREKLGVLEDSSQSE